MNEPVLVTAYEGPDLDGTACAYAYSEFLNKKGTKAIAAIFGTPHKEATFAMKKFGAKIKSVRKPKGKIILVDSSELKGISSAIKIEDVIEVIDHRRINDADKFTNAKIQIEFVGSAATLVAEKFISEKIDITKASAGLLASAIISNTINFKAKVTTDRDIAAYKWLNGKVTIPKSYAREMFMHKSAMESSIYKTFMADFALFNLAGKNSTMIQLEIIGVEEFITSKLTGIKSALSKIKNENNVEIGLLTCLDVEKAYNMFVVVDSQTESILSNALGVKFTNGVARREGIIMRKEIVPLVKAEIEKVISR